MNNRGKKLINPLPKRLLEARKSKGLSQAKLGTLSGMDPSVASTRMNQYENGTHEPKFSTAALIAEVLEIPVAYLYCIEDEIAEAILLLNTNKSNIFK